MISFPLFVLDEACCKIVLKVKSLLMKKELSFWSNKIEGPFVIAFFNIDFGSVM